MRRKMTAEGEKEVELFLPTALGGTAGKGDERREELEELIFPAFLVFFCLGGDVFF